MCFRGGGGQQSVVTFTFFWGGPFPQRESMALVLKTIEVERGQGIPYGIQDFPWSRSENPDHVTGNIRVLRSEALNLDNISNKVQVLMPWSCFLNESGYRVRCPVHGSQMYLGTRVNAPTSLSFKNRARGQTNCLILFV